MASDELLEGSVLTADVARGQVEFRIEEATRSTSPHTGRQLWTLRATATAPVRDGEAVAAGLQAASRPGEFVEDAEGRQWHPSLRSHSYSSGGPSMFSVKLDELEIVRAEEVLLGNVRLAPSTYEESVDEETEAIVIEMRCHLDHLQLAGVRRLVEAKDRHDPTYYPVVRVGVEDRQRSMGLGRVLWSDTDGAHEAQIVLVEQPYDDLPRRNPVAHINEPDLTHALRWAAGAAAQLDALLTELSDQGALSPAAVERIKAAGEAVLQRRRWDLAQVEDLDEFSLD